MLELLISAGFGCDHVFTSSPWLFHALQQICSSLPMRLTRIFSALCCFIFHILSTAFQGRCPCAKTSQAIGIFVSNSSADFISCFSLSAQAVGKTAFCAACVQLGYFSASVSFCPRFHSCSCSNAGSVGSVGNSDLSLIFQKIIP